VSTVHLTPPADEPALSPDHSPEPDIISRERAALGDLLRIVSDRSAAEAEIESTRSRSDASADREYEKARQTLADRYAALKADCRKDDDESRRTIANAALSGETAAKTEFSRSNSRTYAEFEALRERARSEFSRARQEATANYDAGERGAAARFAEERAPIDKAMKIAASMHARLEYLYYDYKQFGLDEPPTTPTRETYRGEDLAGQLFDRLSKVEPSLRLVEGLIIPKVMKGRGDVWLFILVFLLLIYPCYMVAEWTGLGIAAAGTLVFGYLLRRWVYKLSRKQVARFYYPIFQTLVDAEALGAHCLSIAEARRDAERTRVALRRDEDFQKAKQTQNKTIATGETQRDERLREVNAVYSHKIQEIQLAQKAALTEVAEDYERRSADIRNQNETSSRRVDEKYQTIKEKVRSRHETSWMDMESRWREGLAGVKAALDDVVREVNGHGPRWDDPTWANRAFSRTIPPVLRFGEARIGLEGLPGGLPNAASLREGIPTDFTLPALLPFPDRANLLIEAPREGRTAAIETLQSAMLRLLTSLPPGLVRFTIVDPVGIGRSFGAFMHLADFDEALVSRQVWTDPRQIDERLAELAAHMEKVTQKYLRNEYATIGEYNSVAGEVAEPYRVLVIADFPDSFDEKSAARLAGIVARGVPCGVLTLIAVDPTRALPDGIALDDLRHNAVTLAWEGNHLEWDDPDFGRHPLALDAPPPVDATNRLIQRAGSAARDAKRVEVSFEFIAPPANAYWSKDSRNGIDIPLGKAGATKRQNLTLGHGTSQHVLIAGRTGSGKSTLMHALITNLALNYSPDEVDLYLIDFKKGVEFKVYASHMLPHASIVAIESEREFGISVLQRLDDEMDQRGERFREAGVQDLNGYRNTPGTPPLPRVLLIVDEFQEFFVEEDKLAQEAARLLDRLVRQGRAFGVHVLLGSQSLGGAYALARSTLGQMAVRVALQCSDGDAPLILSETNTAAKLLSRPGEAVYNDANGMAEGNHFFQVVWLGDDRRESYLRQVSELAAVRKPVLSRSPIIFEGDAPANLTRNPALNDLLEAPGWPVNPRSAQAWLGDPVAIKEATSALFRRQGGNHLLIVGQNGDAALGVMASALLSLAAQYPPATSDSVRAGALFYLLDGTPEDHPRAEYLARLAEMLPHNVTRGGWGDAARQLTELAQELARRQSPDADGPEIFLIIHDLARFRDLRRRPDDFGFSRRDEDAGPADHLGNILRDGPGLGIHVLTWCDSVSNLNRAFDHQVIREFEMRALFQMSQTDSGHLLDAPHASKLGPNRALFFSEEQNRMEKFRPYSVPSEDFLAGFQDRLSKRMPAPG
jgi:S-DNA-T family DNA segregation ATPase FtsK/SpoIIIE